MTIVDFDALGHMLWSKNRCLYINDHVPEICVGSFTLQYRHQNMRAHFFHCKDLYLSTNTCIW